MLLPYHERSSLKNCDTLPLEMMPLPAGPGQHAGGERRHHAHDQRVLADRRRGAVGQQHAGLFEAGQVEVFPRRLTRRRGSRAPSGPCCRRGSQSAAHRLAAIDCATNSARVSVVADALMSNWNGMNGIWKNEGTSPNSS